MTAVLSGFGVWVLICRSRSRWVVRVCVCGLYVCVCARVTCVVLGVWVLELFGCVYGSVCSIRGIVIDSYKLIK